ncbi:MAG: N-acyl homoserine lactonase family protein [Alphaproteobacteria bacterium]|nr:N-acyl homoserine lactonase family protein [Alphaproteobacteria bacterium]
MFHRIGLVFLFLAGWALPAAAQPSTGLPARPALSGVRLYVIDCGTIISNQPENFGLTKDEAGNTNFADPCFLVMHPKGILLFDTGLPDAHVGRPIYENMMGREGILKFTTLTGELADIGVTPAMITDLAISHSHWDHVGNANLFAGSTWLARKAEYDFMFGPAANKQALPNYSALEHAPHIKFITGDYDVFGDGSVVLLSTPGHSPGHQSLYVKLAHTGGVVISGDLYHYSAERRLNRVPPREQGGQTPASRARIEAFLTSHHAQLWIGHAIDWYAKAVKSPGWYD